MTMTQFYQDALDALEVSGSKALQQWAKIEALLNDVKLVHPSFQGSPRTLLDNIKREWRLTDRANAPHPDVLTGFLHRCIADLSAKIGRPDEFCSGFESVCSDFCLHGPSLHLPHPDIPDSTITVRYVDDYAFRTALKRMLGGVDKVRLAKFLATADPDVHEIQQIQKRMAANWNSAHFKNTDTIANPNNTAVFASFSTCIDPTWDAKLISSALALPCSFITNCDQLFKLIYLTNSVTDTRCPTFADAGTFPYYCPIPEPSDSVVRATPQTFSVPGKTKSILDPAQGVAEFVHRNASMQVLHAPIEYVGEL